MLPTAGPPEVRLQRRVSRRAGGVDQMLILQPIEPCPASDIQPAERWRWLQGGQRHLRVGRRRDYPTSQRFRARDDVDLPVSYLGPLSEFCSDSDASVHLVNRIPFFLGNLSMSSRSFCCSCGRLATAEFAVRAYEEAGLRLCACGVMLTADKRGSFRPALGGVAHAYCTTRNFGGDRVAKLR